MYINSGYLHNSLLDFKDKTRPLVVGSCGTYRLIHQPGFPPTVQEEELTISCFILLQEKDISFLTIKNRL